MASLLTLYHHLPPWGRAVVANLRGAYLQSLRYGPETEQLVEAALGSERLAPEAVLETERSRLAETLARSRNAPLNLGQPYSLSDNLPDWPVLTKEVVRRRHRDLVDPRHHGRLYRLQTSGSTGTPTTVWTDRQGIRAWYALFEARWRRWNGVTQRDHWAILGGQLIVPPGRSHPPFWVWNRPMQQLYLSSIHLSHRSISAYCDAMIRHGVRYIYGYPSALDELARLAASSGSTIPHLEVVLTNAEPLYDHQRQRISDVFRCPVRDTYGMSEMVVGASECEAGQLHLWPEAGIVEILDEEGSSVPNGQVGRVVCTGFLNHAMPLVRYDTGDLGALDSSDRPCPCGRTLPRLRSLEGRQDDVVIAVDGRRIGRLDPVFKSELPLKETQIVQTEIGAFTLRVVPDQGYDDTTEATIRQRLVDRVGPATVSFEKVERVPRGPNGKFRGVISIPGRELSRLGQLQPISERELGQGKTP